MPTCLYSLVEQRPRHPWRGQPFYVGLGAVTRPQRHLENARRRETMNDLLGKVIRSHKRMGVEPEIRVLAIFPDKAWAAFYEKGLIKAYGRRSIDPGGVLCNLASGGQGPDAELMRLPYYRKRNSEAQKKSYAENPKRREAARKGGLIAAQNPEITARRAKATKEKSLRDWANPVARAKQMAAMRGKKKTMTLEAIEARRANARKPRSAEALAAQSAGPRKFWSDPANRAMRSAETLARWSDPKKRAVMLAGRSEGIAASWRNPEIRAKRIASIKATMARKAMEI